MQCAGYMPKDAPPDKWLAMPPTRPQLDYLKCLQEDMGINAVGMWTLCEYILGEYGYCPPRPLNMATASVLIDFFKYAPARCKRDAERNAWTGSLI